MSVNRHRPHIFVLPEDDANRELANGFFLNVDAPTTKFQVREVAGGWRKVVDSFESVHIREMNIYPHRAIVLLIDFDGDVNRIVEVRRSIPEHLTDRVFVLGALGEPEELKPSLGALEDIGSQLAYDCRHQTGPGLESPAASA